MLQIIWLANDTTAAWAPDSCRITNWTSANLSRPFGLPFPKNVYFANGNYERRNSKLADGNANCWVVFERSYSYLRLLPAYSKIARTNVKVVTARLLALVQLRTREQAFNWLLVGWAMNTEFLKLKSLRWPKPPLLSKRALLHYI